MAGLAIAVISCLAITSCGGGAGSATESKFFGNVPGIYLQIMETSNALKEQFKTSSSEDDAKKVMAKAEKAEQEYSAKIEEAAQSLDGKTISIESDSQFTVNSPVTLTFDGFQSKTDLTPRFKLSGDIVAGSDYQSEAAKGLSGSTASKYVGMAEHVYIVGKDADGNEVFSQKIAYFPGELIGADQLGVKKGTALQLESFTINKHNAEGCTKAVTLHLSYNPQ